MAYTVPQFRLFQEFTETLATSTSSLGAVILAPHYGVHRYEVESEQAYVIDSITKKRVEYDPDVVIEDQEYPNRTVGGIVDTQSVIIYLEDAPVVYSSLTLGSTVSSTTAKIPTADGTCISTGLVLHSGNGFVAPVEYEVGDTVEIVSGSTTIKAQISGFVATNVPSVIETPVVSGTEGTTPGIFSIDPESIYNGPDDNSYVVVFSEDVTITSETTPTIRYIVYDTAGVEDTRPDVKTSTALDIGEWGVRLLIGNGTIKAGTMVTIPVIARRDGKYSDMIINKELTGLSSSSSGTVKLCREVTFSLSKSQFTAEASGFSIPNPVTYDGKEVLGGYIAVDYRERLAQYTKTLGELAFASDVEKTLGPAIAANPLSLMVYQALLNSNGTPVYFVAVASDDRAGYSYALDIIEGVSDIYSIVPFSTTDDIQDLVFAYIKAHSNETIMDWKIGWFGCDVEDSKIVLSKLLNGNPLVVSVDGFVATVQGSADLSTVSVGDTLYVTTSDGTKSFTVDYQTSENSFRIIEGSVDVVVGPAYVKHMLTSTEIANAVAAKSRSFNSRRIRNVYSDGLYASSDANTNISNAYLAAACAGLRSASAPHQPLTRAELNGFILTPVYNFGSALLNVMAENGTWLVVNDAATVYIRHQLTTDTTNYNLREDSKTTNADEISRYYRDNLSEYYGRANVSNEFIQYLSNIVNNVSYSIASRVYSPALGPQILSYEPCEITPSETLSDALIIKITMDTPEPLNYLDVYLTIS